MNLKVKLPAAVTSKFGRQLLLLQKNSPQLMFATGVVGVVATTVLACRATLKIDEVLDEDASYKRMMERAVEDEEREDYGDKEHKKDLLLLRAKTAGKLIKLYAPAIGVGVVSVGLLTGSHVVLTKRNAGLMAAYSAIDKAFKDYRGRVREELGDDKDREFRYGYEEIEETVEGKNGTTKIQKRRVVNPITGKSQYARYFDETNQYWQRRPDYNRLWLKAEQLHANDRLRAQGHLFLNEVYDSMGFERTQEGSVVGWILNGDGDGYVDFGVFDNTNDPQAIAFVEGREGSVLVDFNVDGVIWDKI